MEMKTKLLQWGLTCIGLSVAAEVSAQATPTLKRLEGAWVPDGARCKDVFSGKEPRSILHGLAPPRATGSWVLGRAYGIPRTPVRSARPERLVRPRLSC